MTVEENLRIGGFTRKRIDVDSSMEEVFSLFPEISEKKAQPAGVLSGGERQMLVIGRAYISSPSIMLLDEPLLGLSKNMRARTLSLLMKMWERGITLIISEHDVDEIIAVTDRYLVFLNGELVGKGEVEGPQAAEKLKKAFKKFYKWGRNCG